MTPLINILIRHKEEREAELKRCFESVESQTYKNWKCIISIEVGIGYITEKKESYFLPVPSQHFNLHCNDLKKEVNDGYFFYLDDDDYLASPTVLEELSKHLFEGALIVQFLRKNNNGRGRDVKKPSDAMIDNKIIKKGMIGGGCAIVHHSFKNVADWQPVQGGDYLWIKELHDKGVPFKFVPLVLQIADKNNYGK